MRITVICIFLLLNQITPMLAQQISPGHYATVNGLKIYYEIHGNGKPLVLLHGGGSTITTTYGTILPALAKKHQVIAVELQAHGHTADIDRPMTFAQDADDVAALLEQLHLAKADIMGFSNGGTTALQIAIRHPERVNKLILASALYKRSGMMPGFFEGMKHVTLEQMPQPLKDAFTKINPDPKALTAMFNRDATRMVNFTDIPDAEIKGIQAFAMVLNGYNDVVLPEHALELARTLPHAQLAILPGGHGDYIGEICVPNKGGSLPSMVTTMIETFLAQ